MSAPILTSWQKSVLTDGLQAGLGVEDIAVTHAIPVEELQAQVSEWRKIDLLRLMFRRSEAANQRARKIMGISARGGANA